MNGYGGHNQSTNGHGEHALSAYSGNAFPAAYGAACTLDFVVLSRIPLTNIRVRELEMQLAEGHKRLDGPVVRFGQP